MCELPLHLLNLGASFDLKLQLQMLLHASLRIDSRSKLQLGHADSESKTADFKRVVRSLMDTPSVYVIDLNTILWTLGFDF